MVYFSECPDCRFDEAKIEKLNYSKRIWFRREFSQKNNKNLEIKGEGIRGTIQGFFYLILITVSILMDKIKSFFWYWFNFYNFLVIFPAF